MSATEKKPTAKDFKIARKRLLDSTRDCSVDSGKTWVQLYTPGDPRPTRDSMMMSAAVELIEKAIPHCKVGAMGFIEGCAGVVLNNGRLDRLREMLSEPTQKKSR